jgi:hypothetical protein
VFPDVDRVRDCPPDWVRVRSAVVVEAPVSPDRVVGEVVPGVPFVDWVVVVPFDCPPVRERLRVVVVVPV